MLIQVQLGRESSNEGKGSGQVPGERVAAPKGGPVAHPGTPVGSEE